MCGDYNLRREKRYVEVDVRFTPDGKIRPLAINYDKAHTYGIDRVLAVKQCENAAAMQRWKYSRTDCFPEMRFYRNLGGRDKACGGVHAEGRCNRFRPCVRQLHRMPEFHDSA